MTDGSSVSDYLGRAKTWYTAHEATWYLTLALVMAVGITLLTAVGSRQFGPAAVSRGLLWGVMFAVVYYLIDAATGTTRWPDSE